MEDIYIGNIKLDMQFYSGLDEYSDGDIEEKMLRIVRDSHDIEIECYKTDDFPVYYHLSKERELIIEPMLIDKSESVLEIGAGCGAVTGALCRYAQKVDCIDLSRRRSLINAYRHKDCDNLTLYVGNYEDIELERKYDVITLIGVLEYANYYIHSNSPYIDFLSGLNKNLKDDGRIYIAIENRLGAKYFSGCKEDHNGEAFSGIEGYQKSIKARTFSYYELRNLCFNSGFKKLRFYYPYPDYKFPLQIFSDKYLPPKGSLVMKGSNYVSPRIACFDELKFLNSLSGKEEFRMFANSFLVELKR